MVEILTDRVTVKLQSGEVTPLPVEPYRTQAKPQETVQCSGIQQCSDATPGIAPASVGCGRVRHLMWPRSRYRRSLQCKWGTGMCLRKKCLDINRRLTIIFRPCSKEIYWVGGWLGRGGGTLDTNRKQ